MKSKPSDGTPLVRATLDVLGGKWKLRILWHLRDGSKRYGELKRLIPGVSEKVLIEKLRELEENEIVDRDVLSKKPLKVDYRFTEYGRTLVPVFQALCDWGETHIERMSDRE